MKLEVKQKAKVKGKNVITVGRELTTSEKVKQKLKAKTFKQMNRAEKDELVYELLALNDLIDTN